jgi:hypothetical protein
VAGICDTPAHDDLRTSRLKRYRTCYIGTMKHAITFDIGVNNARDPVTQYLPHQILGPGGGGFRPPPYRDQAATRIYTDGKPVGSDRVHHCRYQSRVDRRRGSDDRPGDTETQCLQDQIHGPEPAAELKPDARANAAGNSADRLSVITAPKGAVEVHDMNPPCALFREALGRRDGVVPINGLPRLLALTQANDAAVSNVNGGEEVH